MKRPPCPAAQQPNTVLGTGCTADACNWRKRGPQTCKRSTPCSQTDKQGHLEGLEDAQRVHVARAAAEHIHAQAGGGVGRVRRAQLRYQVRRVQACAHIGLWSSLPIKRYIQGIY